MNDSSEHDEGIRYKFIAEIDFTLITMGFRNLPFFEDDLYLGMQAMNVGIVDVVITEREYALLREYIEIERTPIRVACDLGPHHTGGT